MASFRDFFLGRRRVFFFSDGLSKIGDFSHLVRCYLCVCACVCVRACFVSRERRRGIKRDLSLPITTRASFSCFKRKRRPVVHMSRLKKLRFKTLPGDMNERKREKERKKEIHNARTFYARIYQKQCRSQKTEEGFSRIQYAKERRVLRVELCVFLKKQLKRFCNLFLIEENNTQKNKIRQQTRRGTPSKRPPLFFVCTSRRRRRRRRERETKSTNTRGIHEMHPVVVPSSGGRQNGKRRKTTTTGEEETKET